MSRLLGILFVLVVVILAMAFAAGNAGHRVTLNLGILVLYRAPVTLVAFLGLLAGMLVMFAAGIHTDLKVRRILRERLVEEARQEQGWIDRNQRDLFAQDPEPAGVTEIETEIESFPGHETEDAGGPGADAEETGAEEPAAGPVSEVPDEEERPPQ